MNIEIAHHYGACSTLCLMGLPYGNNLVDTYGHPTPNIRLEVAKVFKRGDMVVHSANGKKYDVNDFAFIIVSAFTKEQADTIKQLRSIGFRSVYSNVHNKKNKTNVTLMAVSIPVLKKNLKRFWKEWENGGEKEYEQMIRKLSREKIEICINGLIKRGLTKRRVQSFIESHQYLVKFTKEEIAEFLKRSENGTIGF